MNRQIESRKDVCAIDMKYFTEQIDNNIIGLEDRNRALHELVNQTNDNGNEVTHEFFNDYFDNWYNPHITTTQNSSENDFVCKQLQYLANYLLNSRENLQYNDECEYPIEQPNSKFTNKDRKRSTSYEYLKDKAEDKLDVSIKQEKPKQYENATMYTLNSQDMQIPQIREMQDKIMLIRKKLIDDEDRARGILDGTMQDDTDVNPLLSFDEKKIMRNLRSNMKSNQLEISKMFRRPIKFNNIDSGRPSYTFWDNTGYYNEQGDYIEISRNKIELSDYKHISSLLKFYSGIKEIVSDDLKSDWRYLLWELEELIDNTPLNDSERDILIWQIDGCDNKNILNKLKENHDIVITQQYLHDMITKIIPKKIVETYIERRLDYVYTNKIKGKYKKCSKCGEVKLAMSRYFRKDKRGLYGLKSRCKICQ